MCLLSNTARLNGRRSNENGRTDSTSPNIEMGKARESAGPPANAAARTREYLTPDEVERMITAARRAGGRWQNGTLCRSSSLTGVGSARPS
jgi:hypothetical protein